jgi:hypothetical protein
MMDKRKGAWTYPGQHKRLHSLHRFGGGEARGWRGVEERGPCAEQDERTASATTRGLSVGGWREERREVNGAQGTENGLCTLRGFLFERGRPAWGGPRSRRESFMADRGGKTQHSISSKTQCSDRCEEWRMGEEEGGGEVGG